MTGEGLVVLPIGGPVGGRSPSRLALHLLLARACEPCMHAQPGVRSDWLVMQSLSRSACCVSEHRRRRRASLSRSVRSGPICVAALLPALSSVTALPRSKGVGELRKARDLGALDGDVEGDQRTVLLNDARCPIAEVRRRTRFRHKLQRLPADGAHCREQLAAAMIHRQQMR